MDLHTLLVPQIDARLDCLEGWIDKAIALAQTKGVSADDLLAARLAPDQWPLGRQLAEICAQAERVCSRVAGREAPTAAEEASLATWDELRTRVGSVRAFVRAFAPSDFDGAKERKVTLPWMPGKFLWAEDYAVGVLANFTFHVAHAYAILRHEGVALSKTDFLGALPFHDAAA